MSVGSTKSLLLKSKKDIFSILMDTEYLSDFENIHTIETINHKNYKKTRRRMTLKNVLPKFLFYILPISIFNEIRTYYDTTIWYTQYKNYTYDIICPNWYKINGSVKFNKKVNIEMNFQILKNFPSKTFLQEKLQPFILDKYLMTIKNIDES